MIINYSLTEIISNLTFGYNSRLATITITLNKFNVAILFKLVFSGFILGFGGIDSGRLIVHLKYINSKPVLKQIELISKPTKRIYVSYSELVRSYRGSYVLVSTKLGLLTREEALAAHIGGLVLFQIW